MLYCIITLQQTQNSKATEPIFYTQYSNLLKYIFLILRHIKDDNDDNDEDDDDDVATGPSQGLYDPSEFDHLPVTQVIKKMWQQVLLKE